MNDQPDTKTSKRGRPKGAKRSPVHRPIHHGPHGGNDEPGSEPPYSYVPYEASDKFHVDPEIIDAAARDWGIAVEWKSLEIMGMPNPFLSSYRRNLWEDMRAGDCEGMFDHLGVRDGLIKIESTVLMRRPIEMQAQAKAYQKRQAAAPIIDNVKKHSEVGVDNISMPGGAEHPSARAQNRIRTSFEPGPRIPDR